MNANAVHDERRASFERFRTMVLSDPSLFEKLRAALTSDELARNAVDLGRERGCEFEAADVHEALASARRSWMERRIL